ncbi:MAG: tyrosine-type recombinase/integrase [Kiritimatiellia bacterium]
MHPANRSCTFTSALAPYFAQHIAEKRVLGCRYTSVETALRELDRYLLNQGVTHPDFTREFLDTWIARRPNESPGTQASRFTVVRQFCLFLERQGHAPYIPTGHLLAKRRQTFVPYIFSTDEIGHLFAVLDQTRSHPRAPQRAVIVPLVFRLLYGCGLRISEALHLRVCDVDVTRGLLAIRETKFLKDRLVPVAPSVATRLQQYYTTHRTQSHDDAWFFPAPDGGEWSPQVFYDLFRHALRQCGISHGGRSRGPRLHDLRHTFACHRLAQWLRAGVAIDLALPILSTYLGHESMYRTQRYLHLFPQLYPDITAKLTAYCGTVIPSLEVTP